MNSRIASRQVGAFFKPAKALETGWARRRTSLNKMSEKRRRDYRKYLRLVAKFLTENPWCQMLVKCKGARATQVHHTRGRGIWYLVVRYWKASCDACHRWENENRKEAVKLGLRERVYREAPSVLEGNDEQPVALLSQESP